MDKSALQFCSRMSNKAIGPVQTKDKRMEDKRIKNLIRILYAVIRLFGYSIVQHSVVRPVQTRDKRRERMGLEPMRSRKILRSCQRSLLFDFKFGVDCIVFAWLFRFAGWGRTRLGA